MKPSLESMKKEIAILDVAEDIGFRVIKKGRYFSLKEHDSVIIDSYRNCFWQNSIPGEKGSIGKGGSVIDFVSNFTGLSIKESIHYLEDKYEVKNLITGSDFQPSVQSRFLKLPPRDTNMKKVFAYLCQTRALEQEVVEYMVKKKQLYQDRNGNCVFVSHENGKPNYGMFRGTNTYKRFMGDCSGNDYRKGFFIDNHANHLIITESVIDAMSLMSLMKEKQKDFKKYDYLVLGGVGKLESLDYRILNKNYIATIIALDNDDPGLTAGEMIKNYLKEIKGNILIQDFYPKNKDWNLDLQKYREKDLLKKKEFDVER